MSRALRWAHGAVELQRLGAMLGPVTFSAAGHADFSPLQVAPWADEPGADRWPGILQRLRGDWPCVPFGRTDRPAGLPADWLPRTPDDDAPHGHAANHPWHWLPSDGPLTLRLAIDYPETSPIERLVRTVTAVADAPALELRLDVHVRRACTLPVALHPVVRLDAGRVELQIDAARGYAYPVAAEPGISRIAAGASFDDLSAVPLAGGGTVDLGRYPLAFDTEELLQLRDVVAPVIARYVDRGWSLTLDWDRGALSDLMLWVSHRGRRQPPWNGRHWALGLEPVHGPFDLGRIAQPPAHHPLADRRGIALEPGVPWTLRHRLSAAPWR